MKSTLIIFMIITLSSCSDLLYQNTESPEQIVSDLNKDLEAKGKSTIGRTKQELLLNWGPPNSKASDGSNGEIYTYAVSAPFSFGTYTGLTYIYINDKGVIYHSNFRYLLQ